MTDHLIVILGGQIAGTLARARNGQLTLTYDDDYAAGPDPTPISLSMPVAIREHGGGHLANWLWGILPDNERVLARWAREFGVSAATPFGLLGTAIGEDCPGAIRFVRPDRVEAVLQAAADVSWLRPEDVEAHIRELREDPTAWLGHRADGRFSLAGAQAKTALVYRDRRWGDARGSAATTHILKPAVAAFDRQDIDEHLCLVAASTVGLSAATSRIMHFGNERAIVIERYDRREVAGTTVRIHQEDLCQAFGRAPSDKYQQEGGPRPQDIVALFRDAMPRPMADDSIERFVGALAWNWLIAGTDAHAKNYSIVLSGSNALLGPLYDVASYLPYDANPYNIRLAMKVGDSYAAVVRDDPWPRTARDLGLDAEHVRTQVRSLADAATDAYRDAVERADLAPDDVPFALRLVDLIAERVRQCRAVL